MTFSNPSTFLPPVLAVGQGNSSNGRQQLGSGLVTHRGIIDANSFRAQGILSSQSGRGLELVYAQSGPYAIVQSYDRDAGAYTDLYLSAKNINLTPQAGGKVSMPAGTVQALIGSYLVATNWSPPQINVWTESPVQASCTFTGAPVRIEWSAVIGGPTKGAVVYVGVGLGGAVTWPSVALFHVPDANYLETVSGVLYHQSPTPGLTRVSQFLYCSTLNTGYNPGAQGSLWVTEQRA